jgi:SAM-dependent methyltransferase
MAKKRLPDLPVRRGVDPVFFEAYRTRPPWDIGRAQPAFVEAANEGLVEGSVLDLGCGTGDTVMEMAERGHEAWGVDIVPLAIQQAKAKAKQRGLARDCVFLVGDALEVELIGRAFDTVIDCGLFHTFSDPERQLYEQQLRAILRPGGRLLLMAMSDWEDPSWGGPRRVTQQEILETFGEGWHVDDIREARFVVLPGYAVRAHAWFAVVERERPKGKGRKRKPQAKPPAAKRAAPVASASAAASAAAAASTAAPAPSA